VINRTSGAGLAGRRLFQTVAVWGGVLVAFAIVSGPRLVTYLSGTRTTAHVDVCRTYESSRGGPNTICTGSWTIDGVRHSGRIRGAGERDENQTIPVRATETGAATLDTDWMIWLWVAGWLALGVVLQVTVNVFTRSRARRRPGPYPPGPYPPGPYQPGPYQPGPYQPGPPRPGPWRRGPWR